MYDEFLWLTNKYYVDMTIVCSRSFEKFNQMIYITINIIKSEIYNVYDEFISLTDNYYMEMSIVSSRSLEKVNQMIYIKINILKSEIMMCTMNLYG